MTNITGHHASSSRKHARSAPHSPVLKQPNRLPIHTQHDQPHEQQQVEGQVEGHAQPMKEQQVKQATAPAVNSAPSVPLLPPSAASAAAADSEMAASESEPEYTAEEKKMLSTLQNVQEKLNQVEFGLPILRGQIQHHMERICLARLAPSYQSPTLNANALHLAQTRLRYNAAGVDERVMQILFQLDSIQTSNNSIRQQRKATVARGQAIIAQGVELLKKIDRWARFLPPKPEEPITPEAPKTPVPSATPMETEPASPHVGREEAAMQADELNDESDGDEMMTEQPMRKQQRTVRQKRPAKSAAPPAPAAPAAASTAAPAPAAVLPTAPTVSALQRKYASLNLPSYAGPTFHSRVHPLTGSLLLEADLSGVRREDVQVTTDSATRTLTIRGVKLPQRRQSLPRDPFGGFFGLPVSRPPQAEPFGHFVRNISLSELDPSNVLNLSAMSAVLNADDRLEITIPRSVPVAAPVSAPRMRRTSPPPPPQPRRHAHQQPLYNPFMQQHRPPVQHYSGYDDVDEDEEEEYSHPYFSRPQQPRYYQRPQAPSFGGWW